MKTRAVLAALLVMLGWAPALQSQAIVDPADVRLVGATLIDFESVVPGKYTVLDMGGVVFSTPIAGQYMYLQTDYSGQYNTQGMSIQNTYAADAFGLIRFSFTSFVSAFAFNWGASDDQWTLTAYDVFHNALATVLPPITRGANDGFTGLAWGSPLIAYAELSGPSSDYIFIDDFRFVAADVIPVPEPLSLVLTLTGLGGVLAASRRRRIA
jgi:hypothetical protein